MSQTATTCPPYYSGRRVRSLPQAFKMIKEMRMQGDAWGEDFAAGAAVVLAEIIEGRMDEAIDRHLEDMAKRGGAVTA